MDEIHVHKTKKSICAHFAESPCRATVQRLPIPAFGVAKVLIAFRMNFFFIGCVVKWLKGS